YQADAEGDVIQEGDEQGDAEIPRQPRLDGMDRHGGADYGHEEVHQAAGKPEMPLRFQHARRFPRPPEYGDAPIQLLDIHLFGKGAVVEQILGQIPEFGEAEFLEGQGIQGPRSEGAPRAVPKDPSGGIPGQGAGVDAHLQGTMPGLGQNGDALPGFLVAGVKVEVEYGSVRGRIEKVEFLERVPPLVSV